MKRNRVLLLVALVATWSGFSRYSAGGGVDAAEATKGTGVNTEVPHLPEGTAQDANSEDGLHTHGPNRMHIEYCSG